MLKGVRLDLWSRPTLSWKLSCEADETQTRQVMYANFGDRYEFPTRVTVAAVFAFIAMTVEVCAAGCMIAHGGLKDEDTSYGFRLGATVCGGIFAINIIWMANTAASTIRNSQSQIEHLSMVNDCADDYTSLPVDQLISDFDEGSKSALFAANLTWALIGTYGLSVIIFVCDKMKS